MRFVGRGFRWVLLLALCALLFASPLAARTVSGLYNASVPVKDRSPAERSRAAAAALGQVLVKLTGNRAAAGDASARPLLSRASTLLLQYGYANAPDGGLLLNARFDEHVLDRELAERGVVTWGHQRPDTVVFLVSDTEEGRLLVGGDAPSALGETLLRKADTRALPLVLPMLDLEESARLNASQDWEALATGAGELGARYGAPAVLVGQLHAANEGVWEARWRLTIDGDALEWQDEGDLGEALIESAVDALGDALARRYAEPALLGGAERVSMTVVGLRGAEDYARLSNYLESLDTITDLFLRAVDNQRVLYEATARGGRAGLAQAIGFGRVLAPVPGQVDTWELKP